MNQILALRAFVPARDFDLSKRFYQALGFRITHEDKQVAGMKRGGSGFILQNFYVEDLAGNLMLQLMVRDLDAFWAGIDAEALVAAFGVKPPRAPAMQEWGLKVGFIFDPSGVLWHVAEAPF